MRIITILIMMLSVTANSFAQVGKNIAVSPKGTKVVVFGSTITVVDANNPLIVGQEFSKRFTYDKWDNPKLKEFASKYKLKEVIKEGETELDKMQFLSDWTFKRFKKFGEPTKGTHNAFEILDEVERGGTFYCAFYAAVFLSASYSVGWVVRDLELAAFPEVTNIGHSSTEIWSNQFRKWIMMDATHKYYIMKDEVPLSGYEISREWLKNGGKNLVYIIGKEKKRYTYNDLPVKYDGIPNNEGFDDKAASKYVCMVFPSNGNWLDLGPVWGKDAFMIMADHPTKGKDWEGRGVKRTVPKNINDAYWTLGEAYITTLAKEAGKLEIELKTNTPNFDTFLRKHDDGEWKESYSRFTWILKKGTSKLTTTTRNKFGVKGPENYLILKYE